MLTRFFPPKWRLRIVVVEILMIASSLVAFANTFDKMTSPKTIASGSDNASAQSSEANVHEPSQAEVQAQLVQMLAEKYNKDTIVPVPLNASETDQIEASISALTAQLNAQTKQEQNTSQPH